jgi:hypothetical protein
MGLDPKVRQSLAAVTGESVATCFGRDLRAVLAALDEAEARAARAEQQRDRLVRLGYYPFTPIYGLQEWHLAVDRIDSHRVGRERFATEAEAIAAVRKAAGLDEP